MPRLMGVNWINSTAAKRVIGYLTDPRPAWLWSGEGKTLIWSNPAARLFRAKQKKHNLKLAPPAVPIKGQIARLIRLGAKGRPSLSRLQFLAGKKPISATCTCTPMTLENGTDCLLVVAVDPIEPQLMSTHGFSEDINTNLFEADTSFIVVDGDGVVLAHSADRVDFNGDTSDATRLSAGPEAAELLIFDQSDLPIKPTETIEETPAASNEVAEISEIEAPTAKTPVDDGKNETPAEETNSTPAPTLQETRNLSSLVGKLADHEALYEPLGPQDDAIPEGLIVPQVEDDHVAPEISDAPAVDDDVLPEALWKITGQGFEADSASQMEHSDDDGVPLEKASRYNFAELSRILTDRVGREDDTESHALTSSPQPTKHHPAPYDRSLVTLSDEALVLNRLPLGILIFKQQNILFANRALTELVGYESSARLRAAGLPAIFPSVTGTGENAGPVTHLARFDGQTVPVIARLQAISWQGQQAFMLSAREEGTAQTSESAVSTFAETLATAANVGFVAATRAGVIQAVSDRAAQLFDRQPEVLIGRPLSLLAGHNDAEALRKFLEQPAKFAETARPGITIATTDKDLEILLFAEGRAGIVSGYFGIVQPVASKAENARADVDVQGIDPAILSRLSRGMRRPLNTIIGFSELIRTQAFGPIDNPRYLEYARDVKGAGQEIVEVIDEVDAFLRLETGDFDLAPADFDLGELLDASILRIRQEAGRARVFVRSAVSEKLPHIRADAATLGQAILNLLASAIEQTPQGGQVVLSAQLEEDGAVTVNVRDSGRAQSDLAERFVVFRDGVNLNGEALGPVQSSVGLALTRSLLAVNTCTLSVDVDSGHGTLLSLTIPREITVNDA